MSIEAKSLRIGNLINYQEDNTMFEVVGIEQGGLYVKNAETQTWIEIDQFEPIPLTEEWLLKMGFEKQDNNWKKLSICNDWTYIYWERLAGVDISVNKNSVMQPHIKYVHQLQNLYFALTGEELTIKE